MLVACFYRLSKIWYGFLRGEEDNQNIGTGEGKRSRVSPNSELRLRGSQEFRNKCRIETEQVSVNDLRIGTSSETASVSERRNEMEFPSTG